MAKETKPDMSCARVKQYKSSDIGAAERHNERKNSDYENINVVPERIGMNVHYRSPTGSYMDVFREMEANGTLSTRGLRQDATLFDEIIIDVNTMYFERNGGYEYAKKFYEEAYHFLEKKFGSEYVVSAVMHADEINKAASDAKRRDIYHYHLHAMVIPVVEKEILWSKRCKDPALRGTVKEVIHQVSHSKKWASNIPLVDENGNPILRKNGKPKFRPSYSILQDELFEHMQEHGFTGFQRGEMGSTREHLTSMQYQIAKDKERLAEIQYEIENELNNYDYASDVHKTMEEIEAMGQRTITGKIALSKNDFQSLTALAKEGITGRREINRLTDEVSFYRQKYYGIKSALDSLQKKYDQLKEKCKPFLDALEHFPQLVKNFMDKLKEMFTAKEEQERKEAENGRNVRTDSTSSRGQSSCPPRKDRWER